MSPELWGTVPRTAPLSGVQWGTLTKSAVKSIERKWRNWQTRRIQVPLRCVDFAGLSSLPLSGAPVGYPRPLAQTAAGRGSR